MSFPFALDRIALACVDAPLLAEARRHGSAEYARDHGVDLLRLLDRLGRPRMVRAAVALLMALELGRPWTGTTRARLEDVVAALERALAAGPEREAPAVAAQLRRLRQLAALDDAARNAAADAALAEALDPAARQAPVRKPAEPADQGVASRRPARF